MIKGLEILCFGPGDWWHMNPNCTMHTMRRLSKHNRILYINPFSSDFPKGIRSGLFRRIRRKLLSIVQSVRRVSDHLYTFSPVFFPLHGNRWIDGLNNLSIRIQIAIVCCVLRMRPSTLWIENVRAADAMNWYPEAMVVYHVSDDFTACPYARNRDALIRRDKMLTVQADLVLCVSKPLLDLKSSTRDNNIHYLPHGVDFQKFNEAAQLPVPPQEYSHISRPVVGYFGTLTAQNDIEILEYCASNAPDLSFIFAGSVTGGDYRVLRSLSNTHFLGFVPYDRIHRLAASFDVCLLPWRLTDAIVNCNPLKFLEYMATGRPIVSVPLPQIAHMAEGMVSFARTKEQFLLAIRWELEYDNKRRQSQRVEMARCNGWDAHALKLSRLLLETRDRHTTRNNIPCE